jgi:hypothetical protein
MRQGETGSGRPILTASCYCASCQEAGSRFERLASAPPVLCNSGMFLDFTKGHWLTMYRNRFPAGAPPLEMRVMTQDRRDGVELTDDLPNYDGHSGKFMLRLTAAWIAMGLRRPRNYLGKDSPQVAMTSCRARRFAPIQ